MAKRKKYSKNISIIYQDYVEDPRSIDFAKNLEKRTRKFAVSIIKLSIKLPDSPEGKVIRYQLSKAGSSVGANYREANRSRSKPDFRSKIKICESELSETQYWIEMIEDLDWIKRESIVKEYQECSELLAIFTSISRKIDL